MDLPALRNVAALAYDDVAAHQSQTIPPMKTKAHVNGHHPPALVPGGQGGESLSRSECQLARRAIREDWPIPVDVRKQLVDQLAAVLSSGKSERLRIAAARALLAADRINAAREAIDAADARQRLTRQHRHEFAGEGIRVVQDEDWYGNADRLRQRVAAEVREMKDLSDPEFDDRLRASIMRIQGS